jgi:hypothetical protein
MKMCSKKLHFKQSGLAGPCPRYSETWVVYEVLYAAKSFPNWKLVWGTSPLAEVRASSLHSPVLTLLGACVLCGSPLFVVVVFDIPS